MDTFVLNLFLGATSSIAVLSILICVVTLVQTRRLRLRTQELKESQEASSAQIRKKINTMEYVQVQFGHDSNHVQEKVEDLTDRINRLEVRDSQFASYHHAAKLVELGANQNEIIKTCGLSRAEADLVALVNRHSKTNSENQPTDSEKEA